MADASQHSVFITEESVFAQVPATPVWDVLRHTGASLNLTRDSLKSNEKRADRNVNGLRLGARAGGGGIPIELSYGSHDKILEALFCGTWAADTPALGTDQLKNGVTRRSYSVVRKFGDILTADKPFRLYEGVEFASLSVQANANNIVTAELTTILNDMGTDTTEEAGSTYNAVTTTEVFDAFTGTIKENGAAIGTITEMAFTIENNLSARPVVGSLTGLRPSAGEFSVTGSLGAYLDNALFVDKFISETETSIELELIDQAGNVHTWKFPAVKYPEYTEDTSDGPIIANVGFQAYRDAVEDCTIILERTPI